MAKGKSVVAAPVVTATTSAFFHPTPEEMERAGFHESARHLWHWYSAGEMLGGWHIMVSLLPNSGKIFIHHTRGCRIEQRTEYGKPVSVGLGPDVPSAVTECRTREQFGTLLKLYGWRMPKAPQ